MTTKDARKAIKVFRDNIAKNISLSGPLIIIGRNLDNDLMRRIREIIGYDD